MATAAVRNTTTAVGVDHAVDFINRQSPLPVTPQNVCHCDPTASSKLATASSEALFASSLAVSVEQL